ncbi:MAG: M16 family metallopeptidase [Bacteroidales bacterium]
MLTRRLGILVSLVVLLSLVGYAQTPGAQMPGGQQQSMKGVVIKGKAPVSDEILKVKLPRPQEVDLPNGIHLMVLEDHRTPQINLQVQIRGAGGYYDPADLPGLAGFTASMMMEGTTTRNTQQIAREQETMASNVSVGTSLSSESGSLSVYSLAANFDKTFDLAADILLNPTFPEEELARFKARQKASLLQVRAIPGFLAQERYGRVIYADHPASRAMPTPDAIDKTTRDAMVAFHKSRYVPDEAIVAIVGDISFADARKKVEAKLGGWKKAGVSFPPIKDPDAMGPSKIYLVDRPNSVQTSLIVGTQAINRTDPDYDVLQILNAVIGGGPTGRLFLNLREDKGWTYGAYSGFNGSRRYRGDWSASTEIKGDVTEQAVGEILNELNLTRTQPVPDKELTAKKRSAVASFALSLESPNGIMSRYIESYIYKLPADYWDKYPERVMAVGADQVQAAAKKYLDASRLQIVAVGDGKKIGEGLKKYGTVVVYDTEGKVKAGS